MKRMSLWTLRVNAARTATYGLGLLADDLKDAGMDDDAAGIRLAIEKIALVHAGLVCELLERELAAGAGAGMQP